MSGRVWDRFLTRLGEKRAPENTEKMSLKKSMQVARKWVQVDPLDAPEETFQNPGSRAQGWGLGMKDEPQPWGEGRSPTTPPITLTR